MDDLNFKFGDFCRLCLRQSEELIYLKANDTDLISYMDKLYFLNESLAPQNDIFPNWLCQKCKKQLCYAYKFTKRCLTSLTVLNETLSQIKQNHFGEPGKQFYITNIKNIHKNTSSEEDPLILNNFDPDSEESEVNNFDLQFQIKEEPDDIDIVEEKFRPFDTPSDIFHISQPLDNTILSQNTLNNSVLTQNLSNNNLLNNVLDNTVVDNTLDNSSMDDSSLDKSDFHNTTLDHTTLDHTTLDHTVLDNSPMSSTTLDKPVLNNTNSRLYTILEMPILNKTLADKTIMVNSVSTKKPAEKSRLRTILDKPVNKSPLDNVKIVKTPFNLMKMASGNKLDKTPSDKSILEDHSPIKKIKLQAKQVKSVHGKKILDLSGGNVSSKLDKKLLGPPVIIQNVAQTSASGVQIQRKQQKITKEKTDDKSLFLNSSFTCNICHQVFENDEDLSIHYSTHKNLYSCAVCAKSFKVKELLTRHLESHLTEEDRHYYCNICGQKFTNIRKMRKHFSEEHKDKNRGKKELKKGLKSKKIVASSSTINEELFECNICSEKFIEKRVLVIHMRKHFD